MLAETYPIPALPMTLSGRITATEPMSAPTSSKRTGIKTTLTPYHAPNCNAHAERFVLSIKFDCTSRMMFFDEASLRRAINAYIEHYNTERPHQGIGSVTIERRELGAGEVECAEHLDGPLGSYRPDALASRAARGRSEARRWSSAPARAPRLRCRRNGSQLAKGR